MDPKLCLNIHVFCQVKQDITGGKERRPIPVVNGIDRWCRMSCLPLYNKLWGITGYHWHARCNNCWGICSNYW